MKKSFAKILLPVVAALSFNAMAAEFATVPKAVGLNWFNRMEEGVKQFDQDFEAISAFQQGPSQFDAALQVQVIEDLIAQGVTAINVVPFQAEALEPVLRKAQDQGIIVVSHEGGNLENVSYNVEAFNNEDYGRFLMNDLAKGMGESGEYAVFVGSLTSTTHMQWVEAAIAYQQTKYPDMKHVGGYNETSDDIRQSYDKMKELMRRYPKLRGVQGSSAVDVVGAGQAVEEAGLEDRFTVVGTSIVSYAGDLLQDGAIDVIAGWDPAQAGYAMNVVSKILMDGGKIQDGMDLGVPGFEKIILDDKTIYGQAWIRVTAENMNEYNF